MSKLVLEVIADSNGLIKGLDAAQSAVNKFMKSTESFGDSLGGGVNQALSAFKNLAGGGAQAAGVLAGAFVAASTAAFAMTVEAGKVAEQTEQLAQKTGISATSIEGLSVALARNGLEANSIALAMKGLSKEMVGVQQGTASSIKLFQDMGVSLDVVEKGTGATLKAVADAFKAMPDGAEKATFAVDLFGKAGLDWIPILNKGAAGLDEAMQKSAEFGLILSETARTDLTTFDDAMDDLFSAVKGFGMQIGAAFAPSLTALVKGFTDAIVFAKNIFNGFADAASTLTIRLAAMISIFQIVISNLEKGRLFSKAAWEETLNHVKAIDQWAAAEIKGVGVARQAEQSLASLAVSQLDAAKAAEKHTSNQEKLGLAIVNTTKIQLHQIELAGKHQERLGQGIVDTGKISHDIAERDAQTWIDSYQQVEDASMERFRAEINAEDRNQEQLGRSIVAQSQAAQKVKGFWETQLDSLVASNAFSVGMIVSTWTSGIANAVVNGGNFVKAAWQSTQVAIIQGALNTTVQYGAEQLKMALASEAAAGASGAAWGGAVTSTLGMIQTMGTAIKAFLVETLWPMIVKFAMSIVDILEALASALGLSALFGNFWGAVAAGVLLAAVAGITAALAAGAFAKGGIVTGPTNALIGEGGSSEAVIPLNSQGSKFMQNTLGMGGGGDGSEQTIIVQVGDSVLAEKVLRGMPRLVRMKVGPAY